MNPEPNTTVRLEDVFEFNRELAALWATGLPLDVGIDGSGFPSKLEQISSAIGARVSQGQTVEQAIEDAPELPQRYRTALWTWVGCHDPSLVLDSIATPAEARRSFGTGFTRTLLYPLIVVSLGYLCLLFLCTFVAPTIEAMYRQLQYPLSESLWVLSSVRRFAPIWGILVPLVILISLFWWRRRWSRWTWKWVPGSSRYFDAVRNANLAQQLATLLDSGYSMNESLAMAGPLSEDTNRTMAKKALPVALSNDGRMSIALPPLLRWAVSDDLGGEPRANALRFVAQTYRQSAHRQQTLWRVVAPAIGGVILGGLFVLGYGLLLFLPLIQLLKDIALPGGA